MRDVHDRDAALIGQWMPAAGRAVARGVVLDIDRRQVAPGTAAEPLLDEGELYRALQDNEIERFIAQVLGRQRPDRVRPGVGRRQAYAVRTSIRYDRHHDLVQAVDERCGPTAVHMPHKDLHARTP